MATTPKGLRYPVGSDSANVAQYFQNLATDVDAKLFTHGGTSGVLAGSAPTTGTGLIVKTYVGNVTVNANGDAQVTFPGGAFPNGLLSVTARHSPSGTPSNNITFICYGSTLALTQVRAYLGTAAAVSVSIVATVEAIGW